MRFTIIGLFFIVLLAPFLDGANTTTFQDFKNLSPQVRRELLNEAFPDWVKYKRWSEIMDSPTKISDPWEVAELIDTKGLASLQIVCESQISLWVSFCSNLIAEKEKSGMNEDQAVKATLAITKFDQKALQKESDENEQYLIRIAPTQDALALNKKASLIDGRMEENFFGPDKPVPTLKELRAFDAEIKNLKDQVRKLPLWSPDQMAAARLALPWQQEKVTR